MCSYNLNNKQETRKFILKNHPDKGGNIPNFNKILECYNNKNYCNTENKKTESSRKPTKKAREKMFNCMRKTANFGKIANYHKFDKSTFSPKKFLDDVGEASPKIIQLMKNIENLDSIDQKNHGHKFKHFIFSDVKEGGYGEEIR